MITVSKKNGVQMEGSFLQLCDEFANICAGMKKAGLSLEGAKKVVESAYTFEENGEKPMDGNFLKKEMLKAALKRMEEDGF